MLLVIADTSPVRYLVQLGHIDLLHLLVASVTIPTEVACEFGDFSAPPAVQAWIKSPPAWLNVLDVTVNDDPALSNLDPGERAAIALGITLNSDLILIDERRGYAAAVTKGFEVTGTLGILDLAAKRQAEADRFAACHRAAEADELPLSQRNHQTHPGAAP